MQSPLLYLVSETFGSHRSITIVVCPFGYLCLCFSKSCRSLAQRIPFAAALQFHLNEGEPVAMSIPATEHSVMTAWRTEREAMENMIDHFGSGILACVMDSYDYVQVSQIQLAFVSATPGRLVYC